MWNGKPSRFLLVLFALFAAAALTFAACDGDDDDEAPPPPADGDGVTPTDGAVDISGQSVDVLGIWGEEELESFEALVAPWAADTGAQMAFVGTRDITAQLSLRVEGGNPPDVAIPAEIGLFQQFARAGELTPLSECPGLEEKILAEYPQAFIDLGTVDGTLYGFWMKADGKGFVWYDPATFGEIGAQPLTADATFDDLLGLTQQIADAGAVDAPWSIGVESAEASGWPGTDWLQILLINNVEGGLEANDGITDGSIPFTDDRMKAAWEMFGQIAHDESLVVQGGGAGINATNFRDAIFPPFTDPPTAALHHQAGFAAGEILADIPDAVPLEDFDFFPWPGGAMIGSANIVYAFNNDPATCSFLEWIASAEAQQIWVDRGGFTSVNTGIGPEAYPDPIAQRTVELLLNAEVFRFDMDDAVGGAWQQAFWTGVTTYLADAGSLDQVLADIQSAREAGEQ